MLDRLFAEFPERFELALAHALKADSLAKLGQIEGAILEYRAAMQAERDFPNVRTNSWLDFGWLIVEYQLTGFYDEVSQVFQEFREEGGIRFPDIEYRYAAIQALIADARGNEVMAQEFAKHALAEAAKDHSGLRYHPTLGLVGAKQTKFETRLRELAGC